MGLSIKKRNLFNILHALIQIHQVFYFLLILYLFPFLFTLKNQDQEKAANMKNEYIAKLEGDNNENQKNLRGAREQYCINKLGAALSARFEKLSFIGIDFKGGRVEVGS